MIRYNEYFQQRKFHFFIYMRKANQTAPLYTSKIALKAKSHLIKCHLCDFSLLGRIRNMVLNLTDFYKATDP